MNVIYFNEQYFFLNKISLHNIEEPHLLICISLFFLNKILRNYMSLFYKIRLLVHENWTIIGIFTFSS
jgi:hypothetical protein